jgi:hypothetical protein
MNRTVLVIGLGLMLVGLLQTKARSQSGSILLGQPSLLAVEESGAAVSTCIPLPTASGSLISDAYVEFTFTEHSAEEIVEFTARLLPVTPSGVIPIEGLFWIAGWEVTPADHENGLGGYVRLYIPPEFLTATQPGEQICVAIHSAQLSPVELLVGLGTARLNWSETSEE